jgi:hypothetical protein
MTKLHAINHTPKLIQIPRKTSQEKYFVLPAELMTLMFVKFVSCFKIIMLPWLRSFFAERRGGVADTPTSYSGGPGFKSRSGDRLSWRFSCVSSDLQDECLDRTLKLDEILFTSPFAYLPFIRRYIAGVPTKRLPHVSGAVCGRYL